MNVYESRLRARATSSVAAVLLHVSGCVQEGPADEVGGDDEGDESDTDSEDSDDEIGDESGTEEGSESSEGGDTVSEDESDTGSEGGESDSGSDSSSDSESGDGSDTGSGTDSGDETGTEDGDDTGTEDGGDTGTDDSGSESGSDSGSTEPPECIEDSDCEDEDTPYCESNVCVDCTGLVTEGCVDKNPATPVCREGDGVCVQCTPEEDDACMGTTPVCDNNVCRGCEEHDECTVACNLDTGGCIDGDALHVNGDECDSMDEQGTVTNPYCYASTAVDAVPGLGPGVVIVHATAVPYVEPDSISVAGNKVVVLIGEGDPVIWRSSAPVVDIQTGAKLMVSGVQLGGGGSSYGGRCDSAELWFDDSVISGNNNHGVFATSCGVQLRRTNLSGNMGDGMNATGGTVTLQDVTITGSGASGVNMAIGGTLSLADVTISGSTSWGVTSSGASITGTRVQVLDNDAGGINLTNGSELTMDTSIIGGNGGNGGGDSRGVSANASTFDLNYTTIANNLGTGAHRSVFCSGAGTRTMRNSIVANVLVDSVVCSELVVTASAVQDPDIVTGNTDIGGWDANWFANVMGNDYHLGTTGTAFENVARWQTDDPATDIDGHARPTTPNDPDWAGADIPD